MTSASLTNSSGNHGNHGKHGLSSSTTVPSNRIPEILKRVHANSQQPEALKTCFGILALMSRDESNKTIIARDGLELILSVLSTHLDRVDLQETGCDLLWSLAFNNQNVKEALARLQGSQVLVRGLKKHTRSADYLKSACGALSNICQLRANQQMISSFGGLPPLVNAIHLHQNNTKLLPFLFDAIASVIVNQEENAKTVSSLGLIPVVITTLHRHRQVREVVKSGCHSLAILSDVKGQANRIAFAGGVPLVLSLIEQHPAYSDLHRVAAVVLLRMLQESAQVGKELVAQEGIRIILLALERTDIQQDTVAAMTHVLYTITNPSSANTPSLIEPQLWLRPSTNPTNTTNGSGLILSARGRSGSESGDQTLPVRTALGGLVSVLTTFYERRDIVRAACRFVMNLRHFEGVYTALDRLRLIDKVVACVAVHKDAKDVLESAVLLLKSIHRLKATPFLDLALIHNAEQRHNVLIGLCMMIRHRAAHDEDFFCAAMEAVHTLVTKCSSTIELEDGRNTGKNVSVIDFIHRCELDGLAWPTVIIHLVLSVIVGYLVRENSSHSVIPLVGGLLTNTTAVQAKSNLPAPHSKYPLLLTVQLKSATKVLPCVELFFSTLFRTGVLPLESSLQQVVANVLVALKEHYQADHLDRVWTLPEPSEIVESEIIMEESNADTNPTVSCKSDSQESTNDSPLSSTLKSPLRQLQNGASEHTASARQLPRDNSSASLRNSTGYANINSTSNSGGMHYHTKHSQQSDALFSGGQYLPLHPLKGRWYGNPEGLPPLSLLDSWPNHLERIAQPTVSPEPTNSESLPASNSGTTLGQPPPRRHLCYEASLPGGRPLTSKCSVPLPYSTPPEGVGPRFAHTLTFDSEFESGNLLCAIQTDESSYDLVMRPDLHTPGHTQWFYFAVSNTHPLSNGPSPEPITIRFTIINFAKPTSLFKAGMQPVIYSSYAARTRGQGWIRAGEDITYSCNHYPRPLPTSISISGTTTSGVGTSGTNGGTSGTAESNGSYFSMSFSLTFSHPADTTLIAYTYPYTYTDHRLHVRQLLSKPHASERIQRCKLCTTIAGQECDLLVITDFRENEAQLGPLTSDISAANSYYTPPSGGIVDISNIDISSTSSQSSNRNVQGPPVDDSPQAPTSRRRAGKTPALAPNGQPWKPAIFISARVHPGEVPASWIMRGFLDYLTGSHPVAVFLRRSFVFYIVPMLNPDGVALGNYRCSVAGVDLNRQWRTPSRLSHPTTYHLKHLMLAQRRTGRELALYMDMHGHSWRFNVFLYGCEEKTKSRGGATAATASSKQMTSSSNTTPGSISNAAILSSSSNARTFTRSLTSHPVARKYMQYEDCSYHLRKGRESTARIVVSKELGVGLSFTLEASFAGPNFGSLRGCHLNLGHYQELGAALSDGIWQYAVSENWICQRDAFVIGSHVASSLPPFEFKVQAAAVSRILSDQASTDTTCTPKISTSPLKSNGNGTSDHTMENSSEDNMEAEGRAMIELESGVLPLEGEGTVQCSTGADDESAYSTDSDGDECNDGTGQGKDGDGTGQGTDDDGTGLVIMTQSPRKNIEDGSGSPLTRQLRSQSECMNTIGTNASTNPRLANSNSGGHGSGLTLLVPTILSSASKSSGSSSVRAIATARDRFRDDDNFTTSVVKRRPPSGGNISLYGDGNALMDLRGESISAHLRTLSLSNNSVVALGSGVLSTSLSARGVSSPSQPANSRIMSSSFSCRSPQSGALPGSVQDIKSHYSSASTLSSPLTKSLGAYSDDRQRGTALRSNLHFTGATVVRNDF